MPVIDRQRLEARVARAVGRPAFWLLLLLVLFGAPLARGLLAGAAPAAPPVLGSFPPFSLQEDRGGAFRAEDVRGHVFIANLLCVHCPEQGPLAAETMRILQHRARNLGDALRLVSFATDGDGASLAEVRRGHPSSARWTLARGAPAAVRALFPGGKGLLLVDGQMRIRGRYDGSGPPALDAALRDAALVLNSN
jgi:cytochrome oxidase Cu insertion factor (SCO1/SenC/PrrC family)